VNNRLTKLAVIPARMASVRLPGKPLLPISGTPMLERVYRRAALCRQLDQVVVATEDEEIVSFCRARDIPVELTARHPSGTDRVVELSERLKADLFVNIQGDQPMLDPRQVDTLLSVFQRCPEASVSTLVAPLANDEKAFSPHLVKVVVASDGRALYFSRSLVPHGATARRWQHIGLYAYTAAALATFKQRGPSALERLESLEQLRFLEAGVPIHTALTEVVTPSVDTQDDLRFVERQLETQA
jgi:3-deoxy-manno-octulosonate cytidylyltransferase (CMP-KDO synthetase)